MSKKKEILTPEEMISRLNNGESAISISLDKWKRLKVPKKGTNLFEWFVFNCLTKTCALCYVYRTKDNKCSKKCPLLPKNRSGCLIEWHEAYRGAFDQDRKKLVIAVKGIIKVLQELYDGENDNEITKNRL